MIFRSAHLAGVACLAVFALGTGACAASSDEALEDDAEQVDEREQSERDQTEAPKVESSSTKPQNDIGEKGSSCPIWQCGFNGLEPETLKLFR